jgi:hypothetical protein
MQNCGTCVWSSVSEMSQGEVTEVRCDHPTVTKARMSCECPDWIIDKNAFRPYVNANCDTWRAKRNDAPVTV